QPLVALSLLVLELLAAPLEVPYERLDARPDALCRAAAFFDAHEKTHSDRAQRDVRCQPPSDTVHACRASQNRAPPVVSSGLERLTAGGALVSTTRSPLPRARSR